MNILRLLAIASATILFAGCATTPSASPATADAAATAEKTPAVAPLKVVTWNAEHLAFPRDTGCRPRSAEEIAAMKDYAANLNADIVAVEEVASIDALGSIFPEQDWRLIISDRPDSPAYECRGNGFTSTQQKVAFAVKKGVPVLNVNSFSALGLNRPGLRYGLVLTIASPKGPMDIMAVHMKSGCFVDDYRRNDSEACQLYAQQAPILDQWVALHEASGKPYMILGDFNHRLSAPYNQVTRMLMAKGRSLTNTTRNLIGCHPRYPAPIDHILVGGMVTDKITQSAKVYPYKDMAEDAMLSDHCAVSVELFDNSHKVSAAVQWQTGSKEHQLLTAGVYQQAQAALATLPKDLQNWVVVMDVDETVLDNSAYQQHRESLGLGYSSESWNAWVASEKASLVPGAKGFIEAVFEHGGQVALITNRDKALDAHTWNNLIAQHIPVTAENTCLVGRSAADKAAVAQAQFVNDKDLRRQQLRDGSIACSNSQNGAASNWQQPHHIVMQIGDNIQDFAGITQESADIKALLPKLGNSLFLLPNPMYGSWQ